MTEQTVETKNELAIISEALPLSYLAQIGLKESDLPEVMALSKTLDSNSVLSVTAFGQEAAEVTVSYADKMLEMVQARDLDEAGKGLALVLTKAKEINTGGFAINRSRIPVIGNLINKFRVQYSSAMVQFSTAREAIDSTAIQIKETQSNLEQRIKDLDEAFEHVKTEYHLLGKYIAAGKVANAQVQAEIDELRTQDQTPMSVQKISDLRSYGDKLQKRIADLTVLQQNALNTAPAIRLVQSNNAALIDKFNTITTLTIPTWKRSMMLGLALEEQAQSVALANSMDDLTNSLLRNQADLLKQNTLSTAKANQRLVIDVDTINHVQNTLISTVSEVAQIQSRAEQDRNTAIQKILVLRKELNERLVGPQKALGINNQPAEKSVH